MGMFDENELESTITKPVQVLDPTPENNFEPAGDDYLEDYLEEIEEPKHDQETPTIPDDAEFEDTEDAGGPAYTPQQYKTSKTTAFFVVNMLDDLLSVGIAAYAHEPESKTFKASKEELTEISTHLSVYFAENSFNLPPWAMATIPATMVLSKKFNMASQLRKSNMEKEKAEKEVAELKREISKLKMEKEAGNLRKEVETLKDGTND